MQDKQINLVDYMDWLWVDIELINRVAGTPIISQLHRYLKYSRSHKDDKTLIEKFIISKLPWKKK